MSNDEISVKGRKYVAVKVAADLGYAAGYIRDLARAGRVGSIRRGGRVYVCYSDMLRFRREQPETKKQIISRWIKDNPARVARATTYRDLAHQIRLGTGVEVSLAVLHKCRLRVRSKVWERVLAWFKADKSRLQLTVEKAMAMCQIPTSKTTLWRARRVARLMMRMEGK